MASEFHLYRTTLTVAVDGAHPPEHRVILEHRFEADDAVAVIEYERAPGLGSLGQVHRTRDAFMVPDAILTLPVRPDELARGDLARVEVVSDERAVLRAVVRVDIVGELEVLAWEVPPENGRCRPIGVECS